MCGWRFPLLDILLLSRIDASDRTNSIRLHIPSNKVVFCIPQQCFLEDSTKKSCRFSKNIFFAQVSRLRDLYLQWSTWCPWLLVISCFSQYPRFLFLERLHFLWIASFQNPCWFDSIAFLYLDAAPRAAFTYSNSILYNRTYTGSIISLPLHDDLLLNTAYFGTDADHNCQIPSLSVQRHDRYGWSRLLHSEHRWSRVYYRLRSRPRCQDFWVFPLSRISQLPTLWMHVISDIRPYRWENPKTYTTLLSSPFCGSLSRYSIDGKT